MLREAKVRLGQGQSIGPICKGLSISEQSYYWWRCDYGRLKLGHFRRHVRMRVAADEPMGF